MIIAIIPAYNEEKTIENVIKKTRKYVDKIIVVNDASSDKTAEIAKKNRVILLDHKINQGLGSSLRDGFKKALSLSKNDNDIILTIDSDGQHNPDDTPLFIEKIKRGYDFVLGRRDLRRYPFIKKIGNFFLNSITNFISGTNVHDTESGFRAFTRKGLSKLYLKSDRYQIAVEIIFEVGRNRLKSSNVMIQSPLYVKGVGVWDGFKNFLFLMHRRERTWRSYFEDLRYVLRKKL